MNLGEQLDELRRNILRDTSDLVAGDNDELWSDETLLRYIKDAERRFARATMMLRDSSTLEAVRVRVKTGTKTYALHSSVIGVLSARYDTNEFDLQRSGHALISQANPPEFLTFDPSSSYTSAPGAPLAFHTDEATIFGRSTAVTMTLFPEPGTDEEGKFLHLRVIRLPMSKYTMDSLDCCSEIPEDYQLDVLEWAAYRALRGFDSDAGATTTADRHKLAFDEAIARATKELKRTIHAPTGLQYNANGFTWTR